MRPPSSRSSSLEHACIQIFVSNLILLVGACFLLMRLLTMSYAAPVQGPSPKQNLRYRRRRWDPTPPGRRRPDLNSYRASLDLFITPPPPPPPPSPTWTPAALAQAQAVDKQRSIANVSLLEMKSNAADHDVPSSSKAQTYAAAQQVFSCPELAGLILTNLPLRSLRNTMLVCKRFHDYIRPDAEHPLSGMKAALGLKFARTIDSITSLEAGELKTTPLYEEPGHYRLCWLLNANIDCLRSLPQTISAPSLWLDPFILESIHQNYKTKVLRIKLRVEASLLNQVSAKRGIVKDTTTISPRVWDVGVLDKDNRPSWANIKLLTMPMPVRVSINVDFRWAMNAEGHHVTGSCSAPGCHVGSHGIQVKPASSSTIIVDLTTLY